MASMLELRSQDVAFLKTNSWLDCTQMLGGHSAQILEDLVRNNSNDYCGRLDAHYRRAVRSIVENSRVLARSDKQHLLTAW